MLPSTGNFKGVNCPFFDSGLCERPYCHFRHVKKDAAASLEPSGDMLEHLVSEAVKKVLLQKEMLPGPATETPARDLVSQVVEELELKATPNENVLEETKQSSTIPSYNPTPIVELNKKRHIPVPYTPSISSKVQLKCRASPESSSEYRSPTKRPKLPLTPTASNVPLPLPSLEYNPDVDTSKCVGYSPSSANSQGSTLHSYTPSAIATLVPPATHYVPVGSGSVKASYEPSGIIKKEPEYMPLSDSVSSSINSYIPTDKSKLLEFNFDDMLPEFEMLDEILQEHAQTTSEEDLLIKSEDERENCVSDSATTNGTENYTNTVLQANGAIKSESKLVNGGLGSVSNKSKEFIKINGKSDFSFLAETNKKLTSNDSDSDVKVTVTGDSEIKEKSANDKSSRSNKGKEKSKSSRHSSSSHKGVSSSKSSSKTETKDSKHSNQHKSKHKEKQKGDHNDKSTKHKSSSSHSTSKDSKKHSSSSRSKTSSSSKSSSRHKSSSTDHKHKSSAKSRSKSSSKKTPVELSDSKQQSSDEMETNGLSSDADYADALSMDSDLDEDEIEQQCLRIFQEYKPSPKIESKQPSCQQVIDIPDDSQSRKRTAHEGAYRMSHMARPAKRPTINPDRVVAERYQAAKLLYEKHKEEETLLKNERLQKMICTDSSKMAMRLQKMRELAERNSDIKPLTSGKVRIAHVPNVDGLLKAKIKVESFTVRRKQLEELRQRKAEAIKRHEEHVQSTVAQTGPKGTKRVAHFPAPHILEEPVILPERGMKIPATLRQKSLNILIKEYSVFCDKEEAYLQGEEQEKLIYTKASNTISYRSSISSAVLRLRKGLTMGSNANPSYSAVVAAGKRTVSHSALIAGRSKGSWSIETPLRVIPTDSSLLYHKLEKYVLTEEELVNNGFPRKHPSIVGAAVAKTMYNKNEPVVPFERDCIRCRKKYRVDKNGKQVSADVCIYHESKPFQQFNRGRYDTARRYTCCNAGLDASAGCQESDFHVCTNFQLTNHGFQPTPCPLTEPVNGDYGVYALDCEMCYTTLGLEVVRVTVVDEHREKILDEFVVPEGEILDYATKFSGVTAQDMVGVKANLFDIQAKIFTFVNSQSILIGHSLDSDLRVLKLYHDRVVDTSIVFPHNDSTKKKALRTLANQILSRAIQQGDGGHDSSEDAIAALDLILWKINMEYH